MERRRAKVNIGSAGGTAGRGAKTYKVTLPITWVERLGITEERRELDRVEACILTRQKKL